MTLYLLNLADLLFTIHAIRHGGTELNHLMRCIPFMVFYKTIVMGALIWWLRKRINLLPLTAVFAVVNVWHIVNLIYILKG